MSFTCEACGQGPEHNVTVYRLGKKGKGVNPRWHCAPHIPKEMQLSPELEKIVAALESKTETKQ